MYVYTIEPDQHQVPVAISYWGEYTNIDSFLQNMRMRGRYTCNYIGIVHKKHIFHVIDHTGLVQVLAGSDDVMYIPHDMALEEAFKFQKMERSVDLHYINPDGTRGVIEVRPDAITIKEYDHVK